MTSSSWMLVVIVVFLLASPQGIVVGFSCTTTSTSRMILGATIQSHFSSTGPSANNCNDLEELVQGGQAELLLSHSCLASYFDQRTSPTTTTNNNDNHEALLQLADTCRHSYLTTGIAHVPQFLRRDVIQQMVQEAMQLHHVKQCFYSTESHTVYQEPQDPTYDCDYDHPRNALQHSSKWIMDYARLSHPTTITTTATMTSPLVTLYTSRQLKAFVSYIVRPCSDDNHHHHQQQPHDEANGNDHHHDQELFYSACPYNAAYYNIYKPGDGLGWHFDQSDFGVNLELQTSDKGGQFELCWNTRDNTTSTGTVDDDERYWAFDQVRHILNVSDDHQSPVAQRIANPSVGPGSLVIFAGSRNLHRVTPVASLTNTWRINAIMTFETKPGQKPNSYSLQKFFGR